VTKGFCLLLITDIHYLLASILSPNHQILERNLATTPLLGRGAYSFWKICSISVDFCQENP
jgi:hypothetical protein